MGQGSGDSAAFALDTRRFESHDLQISVRWDKPNPKVEIMAYCFDRQTGAVVSTGAGSYTVKNQAGTQILSGALTYGTATKAWRSGLVDFSQTGTFTAEVRLGDFFGTALFSVGSSPAQIQGTVTLLNGTAAGSATVKLYDHTPATDTETPLKSTTSGAAGQYQFTGLNAGYYWLRASKTGGLTGGVSGFYANGVTTQNIVLHSFRVPLEAVSRVKDVIVGFYGNQNTKLIRLSEMVDGDVGRSAWEDIQTGADIAVTVFSVTKSAVDIAKSVNTYNKAVEAANQFKSYAATDSWVSSGLRAFWTGKAATSEQSVMVARGLMNQQLGAKVIETFVGSGLKAEVKSYYRLRAQGQLNLATLPHELVARTFSPEFLTDYVQSAVPLVGAVAEAQVLRADRSALEFSGNNHRRTLANLTTAGSSHGGDLYVKALAALDGRVNAFKSGVSGIQPPAETDMGRMEDAANALVSMIDLSKDQKDVAVYTLYGEGIPFNFNDAYLYYLGFHDQLTAILVSQYALTIVKGTVAVVGFGTGPAGIAASLAVGVLTTVASEELQQANTRISSQAADAYWMAWSKWASNVCTGPFILERVVTDGLHELQKPHYFNKNKRFSLSLSDINLHPDWVSPITQRKVVFCLDWGSLIPGGFPAFNFGRDMHLTATLKNNGDTSFVRVMALSKQASLASSFGNAVQSALRNWDCYQVSSVSAWPQGGIQYLDPNETASVSLTYSGRYDWLASLISPNEVEIIPFAGPFQQPSIVEEYWVFNNILSAPFLFSAKAELVAAAEKTPETVLLPARTRSAMLNLKQAVDIATAQVSNEGFFLTSGTLEFAKTFTVSGTADKVIVKLYPAMGADVDLHLYESGQHVGFAPDAGAVEMGFLCMYSGTNSRPEVITVPNAASRTFTVKARLNRINSNLQVPCTLIVSEEPKRPDPICGVETMNIVQYDDAGTTATIRIPLAEMSGQNAVENVQVTMGDLANSKSQTLQPVVSGQHQAEYAFPILPAGEGRECVFEFLLPADAGAGPYRGKATVSTGNAGSLEVSVTVYTRKPAGGEYWQLYR